MGLNPLTSPLGTPVDNCCKPQPSVIIIIIIIIVIGHYSYLYICSEVTKHMAITYSEQESESCETTTNRY